MGEKTKHKLCLSKTYLLGFVIAIILFLIPSMINDAHAEATISDCQILDIPGEIYVLTNDITAPGTCFEFAANGITLDGNGHTLMSSGTEIKSNNVGVWIWNVGGITVKDIKVENFSSGLGTSSSSDVNLIDNTSTGNGVGILVGNVCVLDVVGNTITNSRSGIQISSSSGVTVTENTTSDTTTGSGIRIDSSSGFVIARNNVDAGGYIGINIHADDGFVIENTIRGHVGIRMVDADSNMVIENTFENCTLCYTYPPTGELMNGVVGIEVWRSSGNRISKNIIDSDHKSGIRLHDGSNDNVITGNSISNHVDGYHATAVNIYNSDNNTINYNTISNNGFPFIVYNSTTNKIYNNNFVSNLNAGLIWGPVTEIGRDALASNSVNLELPIGGNYWDKFDDAFEGCEDLNNDNICDSLFTDPTSIFVNDHTVIFELQDNLPWSTPDGGLVNSPTIPDIDSLIIPEAAHCPYTIPEPEVPVCEEPEVLDVESNTCVIPVPVCEEPEVLDVESNTCVIPVPVCEEPEVLDVESNTCVIPVPVCEEPEVLDVESNTCVIPVPVCEEPEVLDVESNTCVIPVPVCEEPEVLDVESNTCVIPVPVCEEPEVLDVESNTCVIPVPVCEEPEVLDVESNTCVIPVPVCEEPEVLDVESNTCEIPEPELTLICHIPPRNLDNPQTIQIPTNAYSAHLAHGDHKGACTEEELGNGKSDSKSNNWKSDSKSKQK